MENSQAGVSKHPNGGYTASIGRDYLGWFKTYGEAAARRESEEVLRFGKKIERLPIEINGDVAKIPLHGRGGVFHGYAVIDSADLDLVGRYSWTKDGRGYCVARIPGAISNPVTMHRFILRGLESGLTVDHISRDKLDNRRQNLRVCSQKENSRNTGLAKNNTSGFKGVKKTRNGKWNASITKDRKHFHIGNYETKEEAAAAYNAASLILHGEFASPNPME